MHNASTSSSLARWRRAALLTALSGAVALTGFACGGDDDADEPVISGEVPARWEVFDFGAIRGAAPRDWDASILDPEEFLELAQAGSLGSKAGEDFTEDLEQIDPADVPERVLLLITEDGYPNVNVQPCFEGQVMVKSDDADELSQAYARAAGVDVEPFDDVEINGESFALLKADYYDGIDTIQAFFGEEGCVSIATLTGQPVDDALVDDFKTMLQLLEIDE